MSKRLRKLISIILILSFWPSMLVGAVPPKAMNAYGTVLVNGHNVPDGTLVAAWCGAVSAGQVATTTYLGGSVYSLQVRGDDPETTGVVEGCTSGQTVSFTVDGYPANETTTWQSGIYNEVNLTATRPEPAIQVTKLTNGILAYQPFDLPVFPGQTITWTYLITNTGNVALTSISLLDDPEGTITCPQTSLALDAGMTCTETGLAAEGAYTNTALVSALFETTVVSDTATSHYFGVDGSIDLEKHTNGVDADSAPGIYLSPSDAVTWTYQITNTGNVTLTGVTLDDDDPDIVISCPPGGDTLLGGQAVTCTATGTAVSGGYTNTAVVTGTLPWSMGTVSDLDSSHYFGAEPAVSIEKFP